ncbi:hypothetical protein CWO89_30700 [Bradyrhizobium sp. Leo170]|nr:hypothetical protein CWO89_30700 [Bradyrhizobium sp. Leo170]
MIALAGKAGINKGQMLDCLSYPYAMAIAGRRDQNSLIWKDFLAEQKFGRDDIDRYLLPVDPSSTQPKFRVIASKVDDLVISLAQYARNNPHPQQAVDHLTTLLAEDIAVVDKTSDLVVGGNGSYKRFDLIKKLTAEILSLLPRDDTSVSAVTKKRKTRQDCSSTERHLFFLSSRPRMMTPPYRSKTCSQ